MTLTGDRFRNAPNVWPRLGINPSLWTWKPVVVFKFRIEISCCALFWKHSRRKENRKASLETSYPAPGFSALEDFVGITCGEITLGPGRTGVCVWSLAGRLVPFEKGQPSPSRLKTPESAGAQLSQFADAGSGQVRYS